MTHINAPIFDKSAPMPSAPMKYTADGQVDWGNMWDSYCVLAQEGGPPHRETPLTPDKEADAQSEAYQFAEAEIIRGIKLVSGLTAVSDNPGWIRIICQSPEMASWLSEAINGENVVSHSLDSYLFVPVSDSYTLKGEIKNVITAVAKTSHYWDEHLANEVKQLLRIQRTIQKVWAVFKR